MTDAELQDALYFWQRVLRLQDWQITAHFVDSQEIQGNRGHSHVHEDSMQCVIRILRPEGLDQTSRFYKDFGDTYDPELTLIHELLHIPLHMVFREEPGEHETAMQEQAIERIAGALYSLKKRAEG